LLSIVHYNEVKRLLDKRAALLVDVRYPTIRVVSLKVLTNEKRVDSGIIL
jgi:hypothetical protein